MDHESLRSLIRSKLQQGLLPYDSIPRIWGAPSTGEVCDACDLIIEQPDMVMEGISLSKVPAMEMQWKKPPGDGNQPRYAVDHRRPLQLHVLCFYLWDSERRS
jgi:hypothetical protein